MRIILYVLGNLLILMPNAFAQTPLDSLPSSYFAAFPQILFMLGILSLFFFTWYAQNKQQQEKQTLLSALRVGDVVYTHGGIVGKITKLHENFCQIEVATNTRFYIQRGAVVNVVPTGSLKSLGFE